MEGKRYELPLVNPAWLGVLEVVVIGGCCDLIHGYASKVIDVAEHTAPFLLSSLVMRLVTSWQ